MVNLESGVVLGFGGTHARYGVAEHGDIVNFDSIDTPTEPREFFGWMARQVLEAAEAGHDWMVAGFPGPVSPDGERVGPMVNVPGLAGRNYCLRTELSKIDPAVNRRLDEGFKLEAVNDGELAAQSAIRHEENRGLDRVAALIVGTGVGSGVVSKDSAIKGVYRPIREPLEIGHVPVSSDFRDTFENSISGKALERMTGIKAEDIPPDHPIWEDVGATIARAVLTLSLHVDIDLIVTCGGVGCGSAANFWPYLQEAFAAIDEAKNEIQIKYLPGIVHAVGDEVQSFELFGGEGVMRDFLTREQ